MHNCNQILIKFLYISYLRVYIMVNTNNNIVNTVWWSWQQQTVFVFTMIYTWLVHSKYLETLSKFGYNRASSFTDLSFISRWDFGF